MRLARHNWESDNRQSGRLYSVWSPQGSDSPKGQSYSRDDPEVLSPMECAMIWWLVQALSAFLQRKVPVLHPYVICSLFIVFKNDYKIIRILVLSASFSLTNLRDMHLQLTANSNSIQVIKHYDNITVQ